jgi:hypothetical protein
MRRISLGLLTSIVVIACTPKPEALPLNLGVAASESGDTVQTASGKCVGSKNTGNTFCSASMVALIANPEPFEGKKVLTYGYVHFEFEGNGVYLHEEDFINVLPTNGLWVDLANGLDPNKCQDSYALLEGTFRGGPSGHFGLYSGRLENVTRCESTGLKRR